MSPLLWILSLLVALFVGRWWWQQRQARQGQAAPASTTVRLECGSPPQVRPNPQGGRKAKLLIKITETCSGEAKIAVQDRRGAWQPIQEVKGGVLGPQAHDPEEGSTYAISVEPNQSYRLECPRGNQGPYCEFEIFDITRQPANPIRVQAANAEVTPACRTLGEGRLVNLSGQNLNVRVQFSSVCKDNRNRPQIPEVHVRKVTRPIGQPRRIGMARRQGRLWRWDGVLNRDMAIMASCPGQRPGCSFFVQVRG